MPHRKRKLRKQRGSRTHGYGVVGQHRGGGQRGGKGKTGLSKHKWSYTIKYAPNHYGKHGFFSPNKRVMKTINVGKLDEQVTKFLSDDMAKKSEDGIVIDLNELGYEKLLGKGKATHPFIINVKYVSKSAAQKIKGAGGRILKHSSSDVS
jgi:large subunit ribosomal protein L15